MDEKKHEEAVLREREEHIEEDLRQIYENESGELPDLSTLEAPKRSWRKKVLFVSGVVLVLTIVIWLGFFVFGSISFTNQSDYLNLEVVARPILIEEERSEPLTSGTPSRIAVRYQNITRSPIASLSLRLNLPDSLVVDRFVPEATDSGNTWQLGNLAPKSDGLIEIYGTLVGTVPSTEKIQIVASYRPANFSSEFDEIVVKDLVIEESALELNFSSTDKASPGEEITLDFELLNPSRDAVQHVELQVVTPEGFQISESEPPIEEGLVWTLPRLEAHSKASFSVTGTFSANTRGLHDIGGDVYLTHGSERFLQTQTLRPIDVFGGALSTNIIINGSSRDQNIDPGNTLRISIPVENASEIDMQDVALELIIDGNGSPPIDWASSSANLGGGVRSGNTISWDADDLDALESLAGGESLTIDLILPLQETLSEEDADSFALSVNIGASPTTNTGSRLRLSTTPVTLSLNSSTSLYTSAIYHDTSGTILGSGPLPPQAGETTTYAIVWSLQNDLHTIEQVVLEAELPGGSQFAEGIQASDGSLSYNNERRTIRWEINQIDETASARFNVSVTPSRNDVGTFLRLVNPASLSARDSETGSTIRREGNTLTTQLRDDAFATDDGIVTE